MLLDKRLVVVDFEYTCPFMAAEHNVPPEIIEIGAILIDYDAREIDRFSSLVCPTREDHLTDSILNFTGIDRDDVLSAPKWADIWKEFTELTRYKSIKLAAWSAYGDIAALKETYRLAGLGFPHNGNVLCLLSMVYGILSMRKSRPRSWKLDDVCKHMGVERGEKHRALADAEDTVKLLRALDNYDEEEQEFKIELL